VNDPDGVNQAAQIMNPRATSPLVLFGAFDRHNFGDLLFPHLMTALLPGQAFEFSGLAARDLRAFGGHRVSALGARPTAACLVHVGGEVLTCSAWQAAVMLLDPAAAAAAIARYDADPAASAAWAAAQLGTVRTMPYVVGRDVLASRPDYVVVSVPSAVPIFRHSDLFPWEKVVDLVRRDYEPLGKTSAIHRGVMRPGADLPADFVPDLWIFRRRGAGLGPPDAEVDDRFPPSAGDWPPLHPAPDELLPGNPPGPEP